MDTPGTRRLSGLFWVMVEVSVEAAEAGAAYRLTQPRAALNKARGK